MAEEEEQFNATDIDQVDKQFSSVVDQLAGDSSLSAFKAQYEKLHLHLAQSYANEKKLLAKIKELNSDIVSNTGKVRTALKMSQDDSETIEFLKQELQKVYKILDKQREREEKAKQRIDSLHNEIKHLTILNDEGNNSMNYKNDTVDKLNLMINDLKILKEESTKENKKQKDELLILQEDCKQLDHQKMILDQQMKEEKKSMLEIKEKVTKDEDRKKKIEEEVEILTKDLQREEMTRKKVEDEIAEINNHNDDLKQIEKDKGIEVSSIQKQLQDLITKYRSLQEMYSTRNQYKAATINEKRSRELKLYRVEKEFNVKQQECMQLKKQLDKNSNYKQNLIQKQDEIKKEKQIVLGEVRQLERQVGDIKKMNIEDLDNIDELKKSKEILDKELKKSENRHRNQTEDIMSQDRSVFHAEIAIENLKKVLEKDIRNKQNLEKEKQKLGKLTAQANAKYFNSLEEIKLKDNLISEFQKKNVETESKLKQQQSLYEQVRSDRNLYSKNLSETQDEIAEIKKRYKIVNHQISQLKDEIEAKEVALAKEHFEEKKKDKTIEEHDRFLDKKKKEIENKEEIIKKFVGEIGKLHFIIKDSELGRQKLKEDFEQVVAERDILGTQLIRRNDEMALLYEKIKIQQRTLGSGEAQYRERIDDIELLRFKISDLMRGLRIYRNQCKKIDPLKIDIANMQRSLIEEKLKVKALSEELENPLNMHRCRKLEGTDPDIFEMREKLKCLQRRLISKTEGVVEGEIVINEKEKQITELKDIMNRQPGIGEAKQLSSLQQQLKMKTRQMKSCAAELNMMQAQANEFKYELEKVTKELNETKRKYLEARKREIHDKNLSLNDQKLGGMMYQ